MKRKELKEGHYVRNNGHVAKITSINNGTIRLDIPSLESRNVLVMAAAVKQETFLQYCFRPGGFGRTGWLAALVIHLGSIFIMASPLIVEISELGWRIFVPGFGALIIFVTWFSTYMNYTKQWN